MKKYICFLLFFMAIKTLCYGQERRNVLKFNPINFLLPVFSVSYERVLTSKTSALVQLDLLPRKNSILDSCTGFRITAEYRYYVSTNAYDIPNGTYIAPFLSYGSVMNRYDHGLSIPVIIGFGGIIGFQKLIQNNFSIDCFFGPAATIMPDSEPAVIIYPRIGVTLGIPF